jgi:hypothetical protein
VYLDRTQLLLLSRGGSVPPPSRVTPRPIQTRPPRGRAGPGRLATLVGALRHRSQRRGRLDAHEYLELEFAVDDER